MGTLLLLTAAALLSGSPEIPDFHWHGPIATGRVIEVRGVTGDIRAVPTEGQEVEVVARVVRDGTEEAVDIRVSETASGVTVCAVRGPLGVCPAEEDPQSAPGTRVNYFIKVPYGVHFTGRTVNGEIEADALRSNVQASTVNGTVVISTTGTAQARTVNGSIRAELLKPFWSKPPEFTTVNGRITVQIPIGASAPVKAETRNGKVVTEVPFRGNATDQVLDGKIGDGGGTGNPLLLRTINGTIEIRHKH